MVQDGLEGGLDAINPDERQGNAAYHPMSSYSK